MRKPDRRGYRGRRLLSVDLGQEGEALLEDCMKHVVSAANARKAGSGRRVRRAHVIRVGLHLLLLKMIGDRESLKKALDAGLPKGTSYGGDWRIIPSER